jgi:hypothetical protein
MFTQVARAARRGVGLDGVVPEHVIAAGQSQSAFALTTYYDGVQPLTHAFDGFMIQSRGAAGLPLAAPGGHAGIADSLLGPPVVFRDDVAAPVMDTQTETDVIGILNSYGARQPDSRTFRLWEVAGTAHADTRVVGPSVRFFDCGAPINDGPMHVVGKAALHGLKQWVTTGRAPVRAPRLNVSASRQAVRDANGIAEGGIRTPPVDVPVTALTGVAGPKPSSICILSGSAVPLPPDRLAELYPSQAAYLKEFRQSADATIKAGYVLPGDRAGLLAFAQPDTIPG